MNNQLIFNDKFNNIIKEQEYYKSYSYKTLYPPYRSFIDDIRNNKENSLGDNIDCYGFAIIFEYNHPYTEFLLIKVFTEYLEIKRYRILDEYVIELNTNNKYYYQDQYQKQIRYLDNDNFMQDLDKDICFDLFDTDIFFIYKNNLAELNNSKYYKYISLPKMIEYHEYIASEKKKKEIYHNITLLDLLNPVFHKSYEYLYKLKLYDMATYSSHIFDYDSYIRKLSKLPKEILNYMQKIDITFPKYITLKLLNYNLEELNKFELTDKEGNLLKDYYNDDVHSIDELEANSYILIWNKINHKNIDKYLLKLLYNHYSLEEYYRYLELCEKLNIDLTKEDNLKPDYFEETYNALIEEDYILSNSENDITDIGTILNSINEFEYKDYIIFACPNVRELIKESLNMHNCVRIYLEKIKNGISQIYFMRKKNNKEESLVTIEVRNNKVVQAYAKYNKPCSKEQNEVINKFEKSLTKFELKEVETFEDEIIIE